MTHLPRGFGARLLTALSLLVATAGYADEPADDGRIVTTDLLKIRTASQIDVSSDGSTAVYVVASMYADDQDGTDPSGESGYRRHLWLADLGDEASPRQLTHGDRSDGAPTLSPDGRQVAFVRRHEDQSQIWVLPLTGGEAFPVTRAEHGAYNPRWSPDGRQLVYGSEIPITEIDGPPPWETERPGRIWGDVVMASTDEDDDAPRDNAENAVTPNPGGTLAEIRAWLARNAQDDNPRVLNRLDLQGERELDDDLTFAHLFVVDAQADAEPRQLTQGYQDFGEAAWLPDGSALVAVSVPFPQHPDRVDDGDLWRIPLDQTAGAAPASLLDWDGWAAFAPRIAPDGQHVAFLASDLNDVTYSLTHLAVVPLTGNATPRRYSTLIEHNVTSAPVWSADSQSLYVTVTQHGTVPLIRVPLDATSETNTVTIVDGARGVGAFDLAGNRLVFTATEVANPNELYVVDATGQDERRLTSLNHDWLAGKTIVEPTEHWLDRPDGTRVQYWVMKPPAATPGTKVPTVLAIHGGPSAMWGPGERTMWHEFQLLLSWGYGVVYANPRGSGGYGYDHRKANFRDWGHGPAGDLLAALDAAAAAEPWIDRDQLVVTGGSYAGYMTAWIITQDHRFKAAVAQRGVYELSFFFGEGNAWRLVPYHFGGYPWEPDANDVLRANSPQTFVDRITTPLLIIHSDQDRRTGVNQSEMLYKSLKVLGRPVEYVRYPNEGHDLSRSGNPHRRMDRLNRIVEFFERFVSHP